MPIYLYVKTHTITGLKYLGKTSRKDPHEYPGSGKYWRNHLNVHGATYTTEILQECQTNDEVKHWGLHYSELWNVVASDEWANLKAEEGDGGPFFGYKHSDEMKAKLSAKAMGRPRSEETRAKLRTARLKQTNIGMKGRKHSDEAKAKCSEAAARRTGPNGMQGKKHSAESIDKGLSTRLANGTLNTHTPESIAKRQATIKANGGYRHSPETKAKIRAVWERKREEKAIKAKLALALEALFKAYSTS